MIQSLPESDTFFVGFDAPKKLEALRKECKELIGALDKDGGGSNILDGFGIQIGKFSVDLGKVATQLNNIFDSAPTRADFQPVCYYGKGKSLFHNTQTGSYAERGILLFPKIFIFYLFTI